MFRIDISTHHYENEYCTVTDNTEEAHNVKENEFHRTLTFLSSFSRKRFQPFSRSRTPLNAAHESTSITGAPVTVTRRLTDEHALIHVPLYACMPPTWYVIRMRTCVSCDVTQTILTTPSILLYSFCITYSQKQRRYSECAL